MPEHTDKAPDLAVAIEKHEIATPRMREVATEKPELAQASLHFQILLAGTLIFLGALFWIATMAHTNTDERIFIGILALGCYLALVSVLLGHKILNSGAKGQGPEP
jgi:hypothetical protein